MKKRQIKKLNQTAKRLLEKLQPHLEFAKVDSFESCENAPAGTWVIWSQTSYEYNEWYFQTAYCWLQEVLYWEFMEADWDDTECAIKFTPDISTAQKVFDLAKQLIKRNSLKESVGGGV